MFSRSFITSITISLISFALETLKHSKRFAELVLLPSFGEVLGTPHFMPSLITSLLFTCAGQLAPEGFVPSSFSHNLRRFKFSGKSPLES